MKFVDDNQEPVPSKMEWNITAGLALLLLIIGVIAYVANSMIFTVLGVGLIGRGGEELVSFYSLSIPACLIWRMEYIRKKTNSKLMLEGESIEPIDAQGLIWKRVQVAWGSLALWWVLFPLFEALFEYFY